MLIDDDDFRAAWSGLYLSAQFEKFTCHRFYPICDRSNFFPKRRLWMRPDKERCHGRIKNAENCRPVGGLAVGERDDGANRVERSGESFRRDARTFGCRRREKGIDRKIL